LDNANILIHQHSATEVQYLHVNPAYQERESFEKMPVRHDGGADSHKWRTHRRASSSMQTNSKILENTGPWEMLAY
jgi:hypothetical protein